MDSNKRKLLLRDISARLEQGVIAEGVYTEDASYEIPYNHKETVIGRVEGIDHVGFDDGEVYVTVDGIPCELGDVKPYLRSMDTMTEEEDHEYALLQVYGGIHKDKFMMPWDASNLLDYLNRKGFDYRGLIPKGLALEMPKELYV